MAAGGYLSIFLPPIFHTAGTHTHAQALPLSSDFDQTVIDKLAVFVARNGPEFEKLTKERNAGNPRFAFLFGGEHHAYYRYT